MKICFFGSYEKARYNLLLKKILELQKIDVIECQEEITGFFSFIKSYFKLYSKHSKLDYDVMFIPWRGVISLPLAKLICKKPIVYIAFISIYDTLVNDRKKIKPNSIKAKIIHLVDKLACQWSNLIITESFASRDYFVSEFGINPNKFRRLFLSADEELFTAFPVKQRNEKFIVLFFGAFIPLHGIDVIIEAAKILSSHKEIVFRFCGEGQMKKNIEDLVQKYRLKNIEFLGFVKHDVLLKNIKKSDLCLGIFSDGQKAKNVVTNKVFQILLSNRALITMNSRAALEIGLKNDENCILISPKNPQNLADAILDLKMNDKKRDNIAIQGHKLFTEKLSMNEIGKHLKSYLNEI